MAMLTYVLVAAALVAQAYGQVIIESEYGVMNPLCPTKLHDETDR